MSKSKDNVKNLLAAIQRKTPTQSGEASETGTTETAGVRSVAQKPSTTAEHSERSKTSQKEKRTGKPSQFWLHDDDRRLIRELAAWLAGQGERPTDSLVVRAALQTAATGGELLTAYRRLSARDGRLKPN